MKRRTKDKDLFSEEYVKKHRRFPVGYTALLVLLVLLQLALVCVCIFYQPKPTDEIERYDITVQPKSDGSLDIYYRIRWRVIDGNEPLTWVSIGLPNGNCTCYEGSLSDTVKSIHKYDDGYGVYLDITFKRAYEVGDVVEFSFKLNQRDMLCIDIYGNYFYELVPCWFNRIDVKKYKFSWSAGNRAVGGNEDLREGEWLVWQGELPRGNYVPMRINYGRNAFSGAATVRYQPFDDEDVYDEIKSDKNAAVAGCIVFIILIGVFEIFIIDTYVSYARGRGFLVGHSHYIHTYGRRNPAYVAARNKHRSRGGGFSGGGCACACACACAGGGRAGCSQKDTYQKSTPKI